MDNDFHKQEKIKITKELLEELYVKYGSAKAISKFIGYSPRHSVRLLDKFGVTRKKIRRNSKINVNCSICDKQILVNPYRIKATKDFTCSPECLGKLRAKNNCGENHGRFNNKAGQIDFKCDNCQKYFRRYAKKDNKLNFCSHFCSSEFYSGEKHPCYIGGTCEEYGPNWHKAKKKVRARDKKCLLCGIEKDVDGTNCDVHHYIPLKLFIDKNGSLNFEKANNLNNLGLYCSKCHRLVEKLGQLFWTKDFFDSINLIETIPTFKESIKNNFNCYSIYK